MPRDSFYLDVAISRSVRFLGFLKVFIGIQRKNVHFGDSVFRDIMLWPILFKFKPPSDFFKTFEGS